MTLTAGSQTVLGGRYRLGGRLAVGGASEIYEAVDVRLARPVAVKVLVPSAPGAEQAGRFAEEARLLAAVGHRHLIPLLDAGVDEGCRYLVMRLVRGTDLAGVLRRGPLPPTEVARIGTAMAAALAHIHARGIVHRDLKPANILIEPRGGIFLADFGIAHSWDGPNHTATGCIVGTAGYLAPEQARGLGASPASDVFSLGLVLLEALTGRQEYTGPAMERLAGVVNRPPRIPEGLSPQWRALLAAMLLREPDRRPPARNVVGLICQDGDPLGPPVRQPVPAVAPMRGTVPDPSVAEACDRDVYHRRGRTPGGRRRRPARAGAHGAI
ncbi:MAG: serine/threonine protein kinase [Catenulisporales bacterium]|nr:serine/threonine protein kinase [Catenulisporales bacterium]